MRAAGVRAKPAVAPAKVSVDFGQSVFVNCPFDDEFLPVLHAMLFAIHDCGFIARFAVEDAGARELRIDKIVRLIRESRLSIHDISRTELSGGLYPRFNMPFEAGLAFGAIRFDPSAARDMLLLDAEPHRDQITLSDLAGQDPKIHHNQPEAVIAAVRSFLALKKTTGQRRTRGAEAIWKRFQAFNSDLTTIAPALELSLSEVQSFPYLADWAQIMSQWVLTS